MIIVLYVIAGIVLALVLYGAFLLILDARYYRRVDKEKESDNRKKEEAERETSLSQNTNEK